jgi:hypothetical protein
VYTELISDRDFLFALDWDDRTESNRSDTSKYPGVLLLTNERDLLKRPIVFHTYTVCSKEIIYVTITPAFYHR